MYLHIAFCFRFKLGHSFALLALDKNADFVEEGLFWDYEFFLPLDIVFSFCRTCQEILSDYCAVSMQNYG